MSASRCCWLRACTSASRGRSRRVLLCFALSLPPSWFDAVQRPALAAGAEGGGGAERLFVAAHDVPLLSPSLWREFLEQLPHRCYCPVCCMGDSRYECTETRYNCKIEDARTEIEDARCYYFRRRADELAQDGVELALSDEAFLLWSEWARLINGWMCGLREDVGGGVRFGWDPASSEIRRCLEDSHRLRAALAVRRQGERARSAGDLDLWRAAAERREALRWAPSAGDLPMAAYRGRRPADGREGPLLVATSIY